MAVHVVRLDQAGRGERWTLYFPDGRVRLARPSRQVHAVLLLTAMLIAGVGRVDGADDTPVPAAATSRPSVPKDTADPLNALRKGVEGQTDVVSIIKRYELLIGRSEGKPYLEDAKADLVMWQDRQAKGLKNVNGVWGDPAVAKEAFLKSTTELSQLAEAIGQEKYAEATKGIDELLAQYPQNPGALYLQGIMAARQNRVAQARKAFEDAATIAPWHAPALNNAAALEWRQRAYLVAIANLEKAIAGSPPARQLLDNVAEVLNSSVREVKSSAITKRLAKQYERMEPELEVEQAKRGMHRSGSGWITDARLAQVRAQEDADQKEQERLAKAVEQAQKYYADAEAIYRSEQRISRTGRQYEYLKIRRDQMEAALKEARAALERFRPVPFPQSYSGQLNLLPADFVLGRPPGAATQSADSAEAK